MKLPITALITLLSTALLATANPTTLNNNNNNTTSGPYTRSIISSAQAQTIISAGLANATLEHVQQNIAIVDPFGLLVAFLRMDNSFPGSIDISQKKARTSALTNGIASADLYAGAQPGGATYGLEETNGGLVVFGGGYPIFYRGADAGAGAGTGGVLIGAIGVSGGTVEQDIKVAQAAVEGLKGASWK